MKDYLKLIRPNNLIFIVIIIGLMEKYVAYPIVQEFQLAEPMTWWMLLLLIVAVVFIAAGGYVINDYFDVKIDTINKPDDVIITRSISKDHAMYYFYALTGIGIAAGVALAVILKSIMFGATFLVVPGLLWFYSASYKRQFLVGNLVISFLAALTPMMVAFACTQILKMGTLDSGSAQYLSNKIFLWVGCFALFAFLTTWAREIIKDIEDQDGDRELECHSAPVKFGNTTSKVFVTLIIAAIVALLTWIIFFVLPLPFSWENWGSRFYITMVVGFICELVLLWRAQIKQDFHHAQLLMKLLMFLGTMFAFFVPKILEAISIAYYN